ncbi:MAG: glycosyltransferase family 2 protein [Magnetococcales bacterium]|nr:glycosyltransferase family 2 protein [Magnetococcales bacterium]
MSTPLTSILVPVFNQTPLLAYLWESLQRHTAHLPWELILVDNASREEGMPQLLQTLAGQERVKVIRNAENRGFGKANNQALAASEGEFLFLINTDMFPAGPWLEFLLGRMTAEPGCGAVQGRILLPGEGEAAADWRVQTCGARFGADGLPLYHLPGFHREAPEVNRSLRLEAFMGTGVLLRRRAVEEVGFFDEEYDLVFMEDTDLSLRLSQAGYDCWYEPHALFIHMHSASMPHLSQEEYDRSRHGNRELFRRKWPVERIREILLARGFVPAGFPAGEG